MSQISELTSSKEKVLEMSKGKPSKYFRHADDPIYVPPMSPGGNTPVPQGLFESMGEAGIRDLIESLYRSLEKSSLSGMFSDSKRGAERSADFFIGLLGGPPLFHQRYGPPRLRMRHLPFKIDQKSRRIWLDCFFQCIDAFENQSSFPPVQRVALKKFLENFSSWMVNTSG